MSYLIALLIIAWIVTSVLTYGFTYSYFQNKYPTIAKESEQEDRNHAMFMSLIPFCGFLVVIMKRGYKYGLKF